LYCIKLQIILTKIVVLKYVLDSFSKAQKKCEMAKGKSDLSSTEEDKFKKKKIRRQNRVCLQSGMSGKSRYSWYNFQKISIFNDFIFTIMYAFNFYLLILIYNATIVYYSFIKYFCL